MHNVPEPEPTKQFHSQFSVPPLLKTVAVLKAIRRQLELPQTNRFRTTSATTPTTPSLNLTTLSRISLSNPECFPECFPYAIPNAFPMLPECFSYAFPNAIPPSTYRTMLTCCSSFSSAISRIAVEGTPSSAWFSRIFFSAI